MWFCSLWRYGVTGSFVVCGHCQIVAVNTALWASYQIRKIAGCACAGNAGNVFPRRRFQRKPLVSDPGMHHGTCVTHVPWCMSGSLTCGDGENVPGIPGACAPAIFTYLARGQWVETESKYRALATSTTSRTDIANHMYTISMVYCKAGIPGALVKEIP